MMIILTILIVLIFVVMFIPTRAANPDAPMLDLYDFGYELRASKPNADGLCMFKLYDHDGKEVAHTDEPGTTDEAFAMAKRFVNQDDERKE